MTADYFLTGCSIGDFDVAIINGLMTSIMLETIILMRQNFILKL